MDSSESDNRKQLQLVVKEEPLIRLLPVEEQVDFETIPIKYELGEHYTENDKNCNSESDLVVSSIVKKETSEPSTVSKLSKLTPSLCVLCNTGFPSAELYEEHIIRIHKSEFPYACHFCRKRFKTSTNRKRHETIHDETRFEGPGQFECDFCGKRYHLKLSLDSHRKLVHLGYKKPIKPKAAPVTQHHSKKGTKNPNRYRKPKQSFECSKCSRVFSMKCELAKHMISHTDERLFPCQYCEASFKHGATLTAHVKKVHELGQQPKMSRPRNKAGEPCVCSTCGKSYSIPSKLARHILLHTGERPHKCSICGLSFRVPRDLRQHRLGHFPPDETGLRSFLCRICGKSGVKRFTDLSGHITHKHGFDMSGNTEILKPFACGICGKPYYLAIKAITCALLLHDSTGLREKMFKFKCTHCPEDFGFQSRSSLRIHWESKHPCVEPPKEFRHPTYYQNVTKDLPTVTYDKEKVLQLRTGNGIPPEVESSPVPLYTALELVADLHQNKERKTVVGRTRVPKSKFAECENCGIKILRYNLRRHWKSCQGRKNGDEFKKKVVIVDCKSVKCTNSTTWSTEGGTGTFKASDKKAVNRILGNKFVSVVLNRLSFARS